MHAGSASSIHLARAQELLRQSRPDHAIDELRRHLALEPDDPVAHSLMAQAESLRGNTKEAIEWAGRAVHLGPDIGYCHYIRAWVLNAADRHKEAETTALEGLRLEPFQADFHCLLGQIRCDVSNWQGALQAAESGLSIDAAHIGCANVRAFALMRLGRKDNAEAAIQSALARDPEDSASHTNQGWICLNRGDRERALGHFREALRLDPNREAARQGVLEALRTKYLVYRLLYNFFEWMAQFNAGARRGIMIGAWLLTRVLNTASRANPALQPIVTPILAIYFLFVLLTWTGRSTFDLLLRLNPLGKLALSRSQIVASNWVGLCLVSAIISVPLAYVGEGIGSTLMAAFCFALLAIPASRIARIKRDFSRQSIACGAGYGIILGLEIWGMVIGGDPSWLIGAFGLCILGFAAFSWIVALRRP